MLARAQQVLFGDWPIRNFEDPGQPLFYLLTSGLASVFGHVLATNVVLCIALQAIAASCTYVLARCASGSTATVAVEVWMRPCASVAGTRCTRCTPLSYFICE